MGCARASCALLGDMAYDLRGEMRADEKAAFVEEARMSSPEMEKLLQGAQELRAQGAESIGDAIIRMRQEKKQLEWERSEERRRKAKEKAETEAQIVGSVEALLEHEDPAVRTLAQGLLLAFDRLRHHNHGYVSPPSYG